MIRQGSRGYLPDHLDQETEEHPGDKDWHCDLKDRLRALDRNHPICGQLAIALEPFSNDDDRIKCPMYRFGGAVIYLEEQSPGGSFDACLMRHAHTQPASMSDTRFMVINIRLSDRQTADSDDPLGRDWYGYDPDATPEQLWAHNRGDWYLDAERIASERWAALNYRGQIVLVAELNDPGHERLAGNIARQKKALIGRVLAAGHSIHDALVGRQVEYAHRSRTAILYGPDPEAANAPGPDLREALDQPGAHGQGLQMDAEIRRAIEDAAQDRLMRHYRDDGWTVTDTRHNRPYDAVAERGGERIYLEAKGTQSRGDSVIVTRNEVDHARQHPGLCMMGVWSGMRLGPDRTVDPEAGTFRILAFDPDDRDLRPRDFDWTLPGDPT